ncbi:MAG: FUSC family protein [Proteobacteria bacterium]|nr:FUSC family protein [Pseudomonadota bacterium]
MDWGQRFRLELKTFVEPGPRLVDELECVLSVLLAIVLAHALGARNVSWAAFSGYMVMRGHVSQSLLRGVLRIGGTTVGAGLAILLVPLLLPYLVAASLVGAAIGGLTLYGALTSRRAYAWLFVGLTFEMVLLDHLAHPGFPVVDFAETRVLEVVAGTVACVVVSMASTLTARRRWPAPPAPPAPTFGWHPGAARHAAQATVALALLPPLWVFFGISDLAQSAVTIMAVMLVPVSSLGVGSLGLVTRRVFHRAAGCLLGGVMAALFLFAAHGNAPVLIVATAIGVMIGRHIENGRGPVAYAGTQFTLAILVTLVPDSYAAAEIDPGLHRLIGILIGSALMEPVLVAWHVLAPSRPTPPARRVAGEASSSE